VVALSTDWSVSIIGGILVARHTCAISTAADRNVVGGAPRDIDTRVIA
jgi:hypothetical protein